jgi:Ni/Co efflux regulator RcnB
MKKVTIAAVLVLALAGTTMAQTAPKKTGKAKSEWKKDSTSASSDTSAMKHHKGMKHTK